MMKQLLLATIVVLFSLKRICESIDPLPEQLHCSSILFFKNSDAIDIYNVVEYLDAKAGRSSVLVEDTAHSDMEIYYNQMSKSGPRQFIRYEPKRWTCKSEAIGFWKFSNLRRLAIYMSDLEHLENEFIEIPIGPSVLLFAINNNAAKFKYVGSTYSKARLSQMHVYSLSMTFAGAVGNRMWVNIMVHIPGQLRPNYKPRAGDLLSDHLEGVPKGITKLALVGVCAMNSPNEDYKPGLDLKKEGQLDPSRLDEDNFCARDRLLFSVRFNIVNEHHPGTLLGKDLAQMGRGHEYHREPFVKPIGIGCWGSGNLGDDYGSVGVQLRQLFSFGPSQFSAVYIKQRGYQGASFVAYDRSFSLLRLDRDGRKDIYDLIARKSYHVGEFNPSSRGAGVDPEVESCVVLNLDDDEETLADSWRPNNHDPLSSSASDGSMLEQLIGLSQDETREHYIGMRVIDHVPYELFESEIRRLETGELSLPIILRPDRPVDFDSSVRLYVTFYARLESNAPATLKFIEVWAFDTVKKRKVFVNRVKFIEFSWSLDVEPMNDIESQTTSGMGLFDLGPCYQSRASQAELVIEYKRDRKELTVAKERLSIEDQVKLLRASEQMIYNRLGHMLTESLRLLRSNLVNLELRIESNGDLVTRTRVVELRDGMLEMKQLGLIDVRHLPKWRQFLKQANSAAYWLRDCQLHSIARREANWLAHCAGTATCLLFKPEEEFKKTFLTVTTVRRVDESNTCVVYSLKYATMDKIRPSLSAVDRADLNSWRVVRSSFEVQLPYLDNHGSYNLFDYKAMPAVRKLDLLDSLGAKLSNHVAFLSGLRHTIGSDRDGHFAGINANLRVALTSTKLDSFRHCQLACQLHDHCASFSICKKKPTSASSSGLSPSGECVLSSLRLTSERIAELLNSQNKLEKPQKELYELRVTNECESQAFVLVRDDDCSLHPRDFLADFRPKPTTILLASKPERPTPFVITSTAAPGTSNEQDEEETSKWKRVSLEDCAGQNFERCFYDSSPVANNFTYCPLESLCLPHNHENIIPTSLTTKNGDASRVKNCFLYSRRVDALYSTKRLTEMKVNFKRKPTDGTQEVAPVKEVNGRGQKFEFVRFLWGVTEEACARECNLHKSNCLAFDVCLYARHTMCSLYSIRSPMDEFGAYSPVTRLEQRTSEAFTVKLAGSQICSHYHLKPAYFQVRLRQILDKEQDATVAKPDNPATKPENEKRFEDLEELVSISDDAKSKQELEKIEIETKQVAEQLSDANKRASKGAGSIGIHFVFLLIGLGLGCACAIFKEQLALAVGVLGQQASQLSRKIPKGFVRQHNEEDVLATTGNLETQPRRAWSITGRGL